MISSTAGGQLARTAVPAVARRCESGGVTSLRPAGPDADADPAQAPTALPGTELLAALLAGTDPDDDPVTHVHRLPARPSRTAEWPAWVSAPLRGKLAERGVLAPFSHQVGAAELARAGQHVVVATGTASGKSLAYQLPALTALAEDPRACVLYLAPTKALARDQLASVAALVDPSVRPAAYDGDTPAEEREWVRRHSRWIVTNPDMLHRGILPAHQKWSSTLRRVAYVVIDECHAYRGVFGSHVGHVLRRLRRICRRYGAEPVFVLASATVADPALAAGRLVGAPVTAVTDDGSPRPGATFALWEPPLTEQTGEHGAPLRRSAAATWWLNGASTPRSANRARSGSATQPGHGADRLGRAGSRCTWVTGSSSGSVPASSEASSSVPPTTPAGSAPVSSAGSRTEGEDVTTPLSHRRATGVPAPVRPPVVDPAPGCGRRRTRPAPIFLASVHRPWSRGRSPAGRLVCPT